MSNSESLIHRHPRSGHAPARLCAVALLLLAGVMAAATAADPKPAALSTRVKVKSTSPPAAAASAAAAAPSAPAKVESASPPAAAASAAASAPSTPAKVESASPPAAAASAAAAAPSAPAKVESAPPPAAAASAAAAPPASEPLKAETEQDKALNEDLVAAAEVMVRRAATGGIKLDYSPASIEVVEQQLAGLYNDLRKKKLTPTDNEIRETSFFFGMYVAEVIRRKHGGIWTNQSALYPGKEVLTFHAGANHVELWPQFKVEQRLKNGPQDNVWNYFQSTQARLDVKKE